MVDRRSFHLDLGRNRIVRGPGWSTEPPFVAAASVQGIPADVAADARASVSVAVPPQPGIVVERGTYVGAGDQAQNRTRHQSYASWRGVTVPLIMDWASGATWNTVSLNAWNPVDSWAAAGMGPADGYRFSLGLHPMADEAGDYSQTNTNLDNVIAGDYDWVWTAFGQNLIDAGAADTCIRFGWEMNGDWGGRWQVNGIDGRFAAAWQRVHGIIQGLSGANFEWCFNPTLGAHYPQGQLFSPDDAWPGDAYVDSIGLDCYDSVGWEPPVGYSLPYDEAKVLRWNTMLTQTHGLNFWESFARAHNKPICFPEWGVGRRWGDPNGQGGSIGDNPYYITKMREWMEDHWVTWENYFEVNVGDGYWRLSTGTAAPLGDEDTYKAQSADQMKIDFGADVVNAGSWA